VFRLEWAGPAAWRPSAATAGPGAPSVQTGAVLARGRAVPA